MAADTYTTTTSTSYGENVGESLTDIIVGFCVLAVGFGLLVWNEGNSVRQHSVLREGIRRVISIVASTVEPELEGELVHLSALLKASRPVVDALFGLELVNTLKLKRLVELYQWVERSETKEETKMGGRKETTTTYSYDMEWHSTLIDDSQFHRYEYRNVNPTTMRFEQFTDVATLINVGAFSLSDELVNMVNWYQAPTTEALKIDNIPDAMLRQEAKPYSNGYYFGSNPNSPSVGDHRVTFSVVPEDTATVVAQQAGNSFAPYKGQHEGTLLMLERGQHTALEMFERAKKALETKTWLLRAGGVLLLMIGYSMTLQWLATIVSFVPFLQKLVGGLVWVVGFLLAVLTGLLVIVATWIIQRCNVYCCGPLKQWHKRTFSMEGIYEQNQRRNQLRYGTLPQQDDVEQEVHVSVPSYATKNTTSEAEIPVAEAHLV